MTFFDIVLIIGPLGLIFVGFRYGAFAIGNVEFTREEHPGLFGLGMSILTLGLLVHLYSLVVT